MKSCGIFDVSLDSYQSNSLFYRTSIIVACDYRLFGKTLYVLEGKVVLYLHDSWSEVSLSSF